MRMEEQGRLLVSDEDGVGKVSGEGETTENAGLESEETEVDSEDSDESQLAQGDVQSDPAPARRRRTPRGYPALSFAEALVLARAIYQYASGQPIRRLTLLDRMGRSESSGTTRTLITSSNQYGITTGGYSAQFMSLSDDGLNAVAEDVDPAVRFTARFRLAILNIGPFESIYERFKGGRLPDRSVLKDAAIDASISPDDAVECADTFLANAQEISLIRTMSGAERLLSFDFVIEDLQQGRGDSLQIDEQNPPINPVENNVARSHHQVTDVQAVSSEEAIPVRVRLRRLVPTDLLERTCFHITPIGADGSEQRKHADLITGSLLEPVVSQLGLRLVRADKIAEPGLITSQVIENLLFAKLVIADLSYSNPNVFYELAVRHATRRPVIQIIRTVDAIPFDVNQARTIRMNMTDIYSFVPHLESHRAEISRQCRAALDVDGPVDNTLSLFYPEFWDHLDMGPK